MLPNRRAPTPSVNPLPRIRFWYVCLLLLFSIFAVRAFYLQVIKHDYYQKSALKGQLKEYEIPASRGVIMAKYGDTQVALVQNETRYTLFADPKFVKDTKSAALEIQKIIGGDASAYEELMRVDTRYSILAKKLDKSQKEKIEALKLKGIGLRDTPYRTYPQGTLAAQLLGFVNEEGEGKYGLEEALNTELKGQVGLLKAITDAQGVPLASNKENLAVEPKEGARTMLTIDLGMQQQVEELLKSGLEKANSKSGSAVIIDAENGAVKAMANFPTYNPGEYFKIEDGNVFNNAVVSDPLEVGSIMKPLTAAAALDLGVVSRDQTYFDPASYRIGDATVRNVEEDGGPGTKSIADILQLSLNTGATWLLMQMGGGELNQQGRERWHDYMINHYNFGRTTGIEQGYEAPGSIPDPNEGFGLNIQYANTTFGQGMSATMLQMSAAFAAMLNGGTYYQPHLVDAIIADGREVKAEPKVLARNIIKPEVGQAVRDIMVYTYNENRATYGVKLPREGYIIGGKTGTAQVPKPDGGYYDDRYTGTYVGFVGGDGVKYVIAVRVNEPKVNGYAGAKAAAPIFGNLANMLIDNFDVTPKKQ